MEAVGNAEAVDFDFDFETQLEPTPAAPQVCWGAALDAEACEFPPSLLCQRLWCDLLQARQQVAPLVPAGAPIGQSIGNYKKNYRQVAALLWLCALASQRAHSPRTEQ